MEKRIALSKHQNLLNIYRSNFNPLLLPKLAIIGYHLKPDSSCQIFFSKIHLFDKTLIERENLFIEKMFLKCQNETKENPFGVIERMKKYSKGKRKYHELKQQSQNQHLNLQEERYRFKKILKNRLEDLNQYIFHVQRLVRSPDLEKDCRKNLENHLTDIENANIKKQLRRESFNKKNEIGTVDSKTSQVAQYYLKLKRSNNKISKKHFKTAFQRKKNEKIKTEPCNIQKDSVDFIYQGQIQQRFHKNRIKDEHQSLIKMQKNGRSSLDSNCLTFKSNQNSSNKQVSTKRKGERQQTMQTVIHDQKQLQSSTNRKKNTKSVKYRFKEQAEKKQALRNKNLKLASLSNLESNRTMKQRQRSIKSKTSQNKSRITVNKMLRSHSNQSISSSIFSLGKSQLSFSKQDNEPEIQVEPQQFQEKRVFLQKTNLNHTGFHKDRFNRIKQTRRRQDNSDTYQQQTIKNEKMLGTLSKLSTHKILRREAFIYDEGQKSDSRAGFSVKKKKRNGKLLGLQANKHLERLLKQQSIQQMLMENQMNEKKGYKVQMQKNEKKNFLKKDNIPSIKHLISRKNDILFEVAQNQEQENHHFGKKLFRHPFDLIDSNGFKVTHLQLQALHSDMLNSKKFSQLEMETFYGAGFRPKVDCQFLTDEEGRIFFNREFMIEAKSNKHNIFRKQYKYTDRHSYKKHEMEIDFAKALTRRINRIEQDSLEGNDIMDQFC